MRNPEPLGELPADVCRLLQIDTTRRVVMIEHVTVTHIFERRSFDDAISVMNVLALRRFNPVFCGRQLDDARRFFVIERVDNYRQAVIAFKTTRSPKGRSRIWVTTGYMVGNSTLRQLFDSDRFSLQRTTRDR